MIFPVGTTVFLTILIEMAFLIDVISRVVHGFGDKESRQFNTTFFILEASAILTACPVLRRKQIFPRRNER